MLTKAFQHVIVRGAPEIQAAPATTVCTPAPPIGYWGKTCTSVTMPKNGSAPVPPGTVLTPIYNDKGEVIKVTAYICTSTWISTGNAGPPSCTTYPAIAYKPAVVAKDEMVPTAGWDSGANSVQAHANGCEATWTMGLVAGVYIGLTDALENVHDTSRYPHSFYFHQSAGKPLVRIVEAGETRSHDRQYANGDEFAIRRIGGRVTYWHAGELVYTSIEPLDVEVNVGTSLYASGDIIQ